jgi:hypothetical protein
MWKLGVVLVHVESDQVLNRADGNSAVDELIDSGLLTRLLAMTEITYSNSMIESWWRALKHQWLYLNTLDIRVSRFKSAEQDFASRSAVQRIVHR